MPLGDWATWAGSIGTAGALLVSLWLLRQHLDDRRLERREQRKTQAAFVAAWVADLRLDTEPYPEAIVWIRNGSQLPVFGVSLRLATGTQGTFVRGVEAVGPGETREFAIALPAPPRGTLEAPELRFTDCAGRQWYRGPAGELRDVRPGELAFLEDPGSYATFEAHPTLRQSLDWDAQRGRPV